MPGGLTLIGVVSIPFSNTTPQTTPTLNTTGAVVIVPILHYSTFFGSGAGISDSKGNTLTPGTGYVDSSGIAATKPYRCISPGSVGASHSWTVTGTGAAPAGLLVVYVYSDSNGAPSFFNQSGLGSASTTNTSAQPGSLTPPANGCLCITGLNLTGTITGISVDSGYTIDVSNGSRYYAASQVQGTAGALNPNWTWTGSQGFAVCQTIFQPAAGGGGTTYTQNLAGSMTPSGTLGKLGKLVKAGASTAAGAIVKLAGLAKAGATTAAGAIAKACSRALAGSSTAAGNPAKLIGKPLVGSTTASGVLTSIKVALLSLAGSLTSSGSLTRLTQKGVGGSTTATGTIKRACAKGLVGAVTAAGALGKLVTKAAFTGSTTASGVIANVKVVLRAFAGSMTPSGAITRLTLKGLTGSSATSGAIAKLCRQGLAGSVTAVGTIRKLITKALAGLSRAIGTLTNNAHATVIVGPRPLKVGARSTATDVDARSASTTVVARTDARDVDARSRGTTIDSRDDTNTDVTQR